MHPNRLAADNLRYLNVGTFSEAAINGHEMELWGVGSGRDRIYERNFITQSNDFHICYLVHDGDSSLSNSCLTKMIMKESKLSQMAPNRGR